MQSTLPQKCFSCLCGRLLKSWPQILDFLQLAVLHRFCANLWKEQFYKILCGYRSLLADWRMIYAPQNPEETLHPCFVASMHYAERVQYLLDILLQGSSHEKQQLLNGKEVTALGKAIERYKETEAAT